MIFSKKTSPYAAVLTLTLFIASLYIFAIAKTSPFVTWRLKAVDTLFTWRAAYSEPLKHFKEVVVVGLDDESYQKINRPSPWGREVYAAFLDTLNDYRPSVIGLDFSFIGASPNLKADAWLAESIANSQNVVLAAFFDNTSQYHVPELVFAKNALGYGFVDKPLDRDGVNRRSKAMVMTSRGGETAFSFSTLAALGHLGLSPRRNLEYENGETLFSLPEKPGTGRWVKTPAETDPKSQLWISYRYGITSFKYIPFWKILAGEAGREELEGKIVLVGPVSPIFHDIHQTPLGLMAGVVMNANEVLTILDKDFVRRALPRGEWAFLLFLTAALTLIFYRTGFITRVNVLVCTEFFLYAAAIFLFTKKNMIFEPFPPMFLTAVTYVAVLSYKGLTTFLENRALQKQVITDELTGLYGHRYLTLRLENEFKRYDRTKTEFYFVMVDIDFFKKVNDTYGHEEGNVVLTSVAKLLKNGIRGYDVAARYGGEEFSLILFSQDMKGAQQTMERIRAAVEAFPFNIPNGKFNVTISCGICSNRAANVKSKEDLIRLADEALYAAKHGGRNQVRIHQSE
ncbi:MAG: diguanylate cyclase [Candidatus Omnitrophica bacterium]|nr:diguanylate cyclase [Candidatus Omnitrophota bacterium]